MLILPAIDLMDGHVVRLKQGKAEEKTVYSNTPVEIAKHWQKLGADYLHIVDLDGAFNGKPQNFETVQQIVTKLKISCQLGGGIRTLADIGRALQAGVQRVILGSQACASPDFVRQAVQQFGGERIAVGIDAKEGKVAVSGWTQSTDWDAVDLAKAVVEAGVKTIIYTDIATDGMLEGPNFGAIWNLRENVPVNIIASGGVSSLDDIQKLNTIPGLYGVIIGKALYDKQLDFSQCLSITQ